jgi:hypothetical protein
MSESENNQAGLFDGPPEPRQVCELFSERLYRVIAGVDRRDMTAAGLAAANAHYRSASMVWRPIESRTYKLRK